MAAASEIVFTWARMYSQILDRVQQVGEEKGTHIHIE
jgi:hypothetical protein